MTEIKMTDREFDVFECAADYLEDFDHTATREDVIDYVKAAVRDAIELEERGPAGSQFMSYQIAEGVVDDIVEDFPSNTDET